MANVLPLTPEERVNAMIQVGKDTRDGYLVMVTRKGLIKRCALKLFENVRKSGVRAIELNEGDDLAWVRLTSGGDKLIIATRKGMAIRIDENDVRPMGRGARGVKAIQLAAGDEVAGMARTRPGGTLLTVTETGYGRRSEIGDYRLQSRGGKGLINYRTALYGDVAAIKVVDDDDDVMMISSDGVVIRVAVKDLRVLARPAKGVRVMRIDPDSETKLVSIARTPHEDDEEHEAVIVEGDAEEGAGVTEGEEPEEQTGPEEDEVLNAEE